MDQFLVDDRPPGQQTTIGDIAGAWGSNGCPHCQHGRGRGRLRPSRLSAAVTGLDAVFSGAGTLDYWPRIRNTLPACSRALAQNQNGIRSWHQNQNQNQNQTQNDACMAATLKPCEPAGASWPGRHAGPHCFRCRAGPRQHSPPGRACTASPDSGCETTTG